MIHEGATLLNMSILSSCDPPAKKLSAVATTIKMIYLFADESLVKAFIMDVPYLHFGLVLGLSISVHSLIASSSGLKPFQGAQSAKSIKENALLCFTGRPCLRLSIDIL